jgi:hypothetical protein
MRDRILISWIAACAVIFLSTSPATSEQIYTSGSSALGSAQSVTTPGRISSPFKVTKDAYLTDGDAIFWVWEGNKPTSFNWTIGRAAFGSDVGSGTVSSVTPTLIQAGPSWDKYRGSFSLSGMLALDDSQDSYWLTLSQGYASGGPPSSGHSLFWGFPYSSPTTAYYDSGSGTPSSLFHPYFSLNGTAVPEPSTFVALAGLVGIGLSGRSWRSRRARVY